MGILQIPLQIMQRFSPVVEVFSSVFRFQQLRRAVSGGGFLYLFAIRSAA